MPHSSKYYFPLFLVLTAFLTAGIGWQWIQVTTETGSYYFYGVPEEAPKDALEVKLYQAQKEATEQALRDAKPEKREVKGIYLTAYTASNDNAREKLINLIDTTELNAVVIDIKDYTGYLLYDSQLPLVNELGTDKDRLGDVKRIVDEFHKHNIYVIARQTVFQDPVLAVKKPAWAIASKNGGLWHDNKGLAWVDPTKEDVWQYNVDIAKEAISFGFDEVQFDYVRFPSDGNMSTVVYTNGSEEKYTIMNHFYTFLGEQLADDPAWISLDMFGFVMERHDGMNIGQRLEDAVGNVDYISPMMYPSHYPTGHLGLANPAASPGLVIENGMKKGMPYFQDTKTQARPWIQAFNIGAVYGATNIRAQIDTVEKYTDGGWLLWNASNRYSSAGLLPSGE
ncbi:MAG: GTP-binding protein [Candidatus Magasanikbacteria bacterium CG10_big_fil_rev_8_21_14_0_10_42_10]|uniref:GTP-binding protein n=2 Tax=Candidatus Magasanikiibacteriota TaxID=1752731 RepID=A0A2H0TX61_9BACT|nr:MAG: GTP-binding protein [Candidatus Magasanikbacteria bacterium CG10_big_fil_rev_8_21_14_0_10_42_10]PIZ94456.1 MAG: GTP-binding protein [Candidatus Magasanikbacteria bacterium CG_4_10_14_0_2_um_filter_41_10]